ncbi:hypothetical protein [Hymenobacter wooponensis]|uniref:Uncharacterized protein n=1 Tax=Hymenobacter wooponensis TaxID=1525360 RepID=A0A4Z0MI92_9BACT|nr:hypothetical protein [Hymenobacter wooponensis]TGD79532.1 hypothetical protein EU557_15010 [Hymenobacter wooponensis]
MIPFITAELSSEEAFWAMFYFVQENYELSNGTFDVSDILSASQPMEFATNGHIDGLASGSRTIAPADNGMVSF